MMSEMSTFSGAEKEAKAKEAASDPDRIERLQTFMRWSHANPVYPCFMDGFIADIEDYKRPINFEEISVPTLIIHGDQDGDIPYAQA